ncbi:retrotransposon protein [Cucumis melo var. makuwa]|uniref:Retrotransposon protein n=1 Tax=Cucumis melo var. makuwa TaxID=1194695 RepID=A0A5A7TGD4_CUCMM|nr:retrotransposon protein [Cucumis melo var. makuwa]TYK22904.1 retrotransposon protein [Cucumis melo var. makuwa]
MTTSSRALKHVWTKEEKDTLVECLVELVSIEGWKFNNAYNGFNWNDDAKCIIIEKEIFDNWVRYGELAIVFIRDKATGRFTGTFVDVGSNESVGYEGFDMSYGNEEFPSMYNHGIWEWPARALANDNHIPDDERQSFCRVLLGDISR